MIGRAGKGNVHRSLFLSVAIISIAISFFFANLYSSAFNSNNYATCEACHVIERDEFAKTMVHKTLKCTSCHNISEFGSDLYSHNATTLQCIQCHTVQENQFYDDAHNELANSSNRTEIFNGTNEMCVVCHSGIEMELEWHSYNSTNMTVSGVSGSWNITLSTHGDNVSLNYTNYSFYLNRT